MPLPCSSKPLQYAESGVSARSHVEGMISPKPPLGGISGFKGSNESWRAYLVAQLVKNLSAMPQTPV